MHILFTKIAFLLILTITIYVIDYFMNLAIMNAQEKVPTKLYYKILSFSEYPNPLLEKKIVATIFIFYFFSCLFFMCFCKFWARDVLNLHSGHWCGLLWAKRWRLSLSVRGVVNSQTEHLWITTCSFFLCSTQSLYVLEVKGHWLQVYGPLLWIRIWRVKLSFFWNCLPHDVHFKAGLSSVKFWSIFFDELEVVEL